MEQPKTHPELPPTQPAPEIIPARPERPKETPRPEIRPGKDPAPSKGPSEIPPGKE